MKFSRLWAIPSSSTFDIKPIRAFVQKYLSRSSISVDPFARNCLWATYTNDLNPGTKAQYHLPAKIFLQNLAKFKVQADLIILDPPYSPGQIKECYESSNLIFSQVDAQNAKLYSEVREAVIPILSPDGIVLSFGWNSGGMGKKHGFEIIEILLVAHGGAHNDTICMAESRPNIS